MLTFAEFKSNCVGVRKGVFSTGDISRTSSLGDGRAEEKRLNTWPLSRGPFQRGELSLSIKWH